MISSGNKKIFFFVILFLIFLLKYAQSLENKIVTKVNNEIITSLDIKKKFKI